MLSMTTDYVTSTGCPGPYLRAIAEAGFSHVHWCHEWDTDVAYSDDQIDQIRRWLREYGLGLTDLHASSGKQKCWGSLLARERVSGVGLVKNRIDMAARLESNVVIMHLPSQPVPAERANRLWDGLFSSLDDLRPYAEQRGVRIALENGDFDAIEGVLSQYGPEYLGLCYDSGHGNIGGDGLGRLERVKDRLISIHLHDNNGSSDQHSLPLTGTVDWPRLAGIVAASSYGKWVSLEAVMRNCPIRDEEVFLRAAFEAGSRIARMIADCRGRPPDPERS